MERVGLKIKRWSHYKGELPKYQTHGASGFDVVAQIEQTLVLKPGERILVPTALSFEIPLGYEIQVRSRSGLAAKQGLMVLNTPGTIDADYRGEVKVILANLGQEAVEIKSGDRIAQFILCPVVQAKFLEVEALEETSRGVGGFGSTGV